MIKVIINKSYGGFGTFSEEAVKLYHELGGENLKFTKYSNDYECYNANRTDKILIQVIEQLGSKAGAGFSSYTIEEVPEDFDWDIDEYDGMESLILIPLLSIDKLIALSNDIESLKQYLKTMNIRYKDEKTPKIKIQSNFDYTCVKQVARLKKQLDILKDKLKWWHNLLDQDGINSKKIVREEIAKVLEEEND